MPEGIDRSMPAVAMTNVVPTLTTVRIDTFSASCWMLLTVSNLPGASTEKMTIITTRKRNVTMTGLATSRRHSGALESTDIPAPSAASTSGSASPSAVASIAATSDWPAVT